MIRKLQYIENAVADGLTGTKRSDHITGILKALHWLPVITEHNRSLCCLFLNQYTGLGFKIDIFCWACEDR